MIGLIKMKFSLEHKKNAILKAIESEECLIEVAFQGRANIVWADQSVSKIEYSKCKDFFYTGFIESYAIIVNSVEILGDAEAEKLLEKIGKDRLKWIDENLKKGK